MVSRCKVSRCKVALATVIILVVAGGPAGLASAECWWPPVSAPISDRFREPGCPWCPGNRGIEYATTPGQRVVNVATGWVTFAGSVAGTSYVVVDVGSGRRVTYGRLLAVGHDVGDLVVRGTPLGRAGPGFHLGVRSGERYVDPTPLIGWFVGRPRLVPVTGAPPAAAPAPMLRCGEGGRRERPPGAIAAHPGSMVNRFTDR